MKGIGTVAIAGLAVVALFYPHTAWVFVAAEGGFLAWLAHGTRRADAAALLAAAGEPLEPDEAELVRRYAFYFARPSVARECASMLAVAGLASLLLVPWLTYKMQWLPAIAIGLCLFAVAWLSKLLAPAHSLSLTAAKGNREALRLLSAYDGAFRKVAGRAL